MRIVSGKEGVVQGFTSSDVRVMNGRRTSSGDMRKGIWRVEIVTPDGRCLRPSATLVDLSTTDGQIGVMPGHAPLLTVLEVGELVIHNGHEKDTHLAGGGFARVRPESLSVLAFTLDDRMDVAAMEECHSRCREWIGHDEPEAR